VFFLALKKHKKDKGWDERKEGIGTRERGREKSLFLIYRKLGEDKTAIRQRKGKTRLGEEAFRKRHLRERPLERGDEKSVRVHWEEVEEGVRFAGGKLPSHWLEDFGPRRQQDGKKKGETKTKCEAGPGGSLLRMGKKGGLIKDSERFPDLVAGPRFGALGDAFSLVLPKKSQIKSGLEGGGKRGEGR